MKKIIIAVVFGFLFYIPVSAQTVDQVSLNAQLVSVLTQTIQLLIQQVTELQRQLGLALEGVKNEDGTKVTFVPAPVVPTFTPSNSIPILAGNSGVASSSNAIACTELPTIDFKVESKGYVLNGIATMFLSDAHNLYVTAIDPCSKTDDGWNPQYTPQYFSSINTDVFVGNSNVPSYEYRSFNSLISTISTTTTQKVVTTATTKDGRTSTKSIIVNIYEQ